MYVRILFLYGISQNDVQFLDRLFLWDVFEVLFQERSSLMKLFVLHSFTPFVILRWNCFFIFISAILKEHFISYIWHEIFVFIFVTSFTSIVLSEMWSSYIKDMLLRYVDEIVFPSVHLIICLFAYFFVYYFASKLS